MAEEDDWELDLLDLGLEEEFKHKASIISPEETQKQDEVSVTPKLKDGSSLIRSEPQGSSTEVDNVPDYEEIEDDFPLPWTIRKESFDDSSFKGSLENKDDSGIDIKPDLGFTFDHLHSSDAHNSNEPISASKERQTLNGSPVLQDLVTTDTGTSLTSVLRSSYLLDFQEHPRDKEQGERWKSDKVSKDSLPDLPDLSQEVTDRLSPRIDSVTMEADMDDDDSFMVQDYYCRPKTVKGKKTRLHPYMGETLVKGKHSAKGQTRIKASKKPQKLLKQFVAEERAIAAPLKTLSYPYILPPVPPPMRPVAPPSFECEACHLMRSHNSITQCCGGHVVCTQCVEKEAKLVIVGTKKGSVACSVALCNGSIPQSELRKSLPSIVLDLLEESWKKETLEALENMTDGVKCPGCNTFGVLDSHIKNFKCVNCHKTYCRLCQLEWHVKRHNLCIKMTKKVSEATGHTIHIPAHWTLDEDTERQMGFSVELLDQMSEEYLDILSQFYTSQRKASSVSVNKIYRVQNQRLWEKYSLFRMHLIQDIGEMHIKEKRLFHGTNTKVIDNICKEGFDWRLCGKHGTAYGHGTYFAYDSLYSLRYSSVSGSNWTPPMGHTTAKISEPAFPPSYTQSFSFNVLTGRAPSQQVPTSGHTLNDTSGVPAPTPGHHLYGGNQTSSNTGPVPMQMDQMSSNTVSAVPSTSAGPSSASFTGLSVSDLLSPMNSSSFPLPYAVSPTSLLHNTYSLRTGKLVDTQTPQADLMKYMFVGRVLVGRKCLGRPDLRRPEKDAQGNVCHTAVDDVHHSRIYVVFESGQCYPEYLIEFSK